VTYIKANSGSICDVCEDRERLIKGKPDEMETIQAYNDKHHYHPHKPKPHRNVLYLQSYRNVTEKYLRHHRILKTRVDET
jgi:hypothetical protein